MNALILILIALVLLGLWMLANFLLMDKDRETQLGMQRGQIQTSGFYALIREDPWERIREKAAKPERQELLEWLASQPEEGLKGRSPDEWVDEYLDYLDRNVRVVTLADRDGVETFGFELGEGAVEFLGSYIHSGTYVTRETLHNNPHLIPPYFLGDTTRLRAREPWKERGDRGWEPLLPNRQGRYEIPDWRKHDLV